MYTKSIWHEFVTPQDYPTLSKHTETDVAIIGGGITGITTAFLLAQKGFRVVVLESMKVGGGTTSHSTGNLYFTVDKNLSQLYSKYDAEVIRQVVTSRSAALNQIEILVQQFNIHCDFRRVPWVLYAGLSSNNKLIEDEYEYAQEAGIPVSWSEAIDIPAPFTKAVEVKNQAQINPMMYVGELAKAIRSDKLEIFENTMVMAVEDNDTHVKLETTGGTVTARYVDRKSTRLNSSHVRISYAVFCLKKKKIRILIDYIT